LKISREEITSVDGRITLIGQISCDNTTWIELPQDTVQWWAFVNVVMNFQFPYKQEFLYQMNNCQWFEKEVFCMLQFVYEINITYRKIQAC
jgi:hypothetical protein